MESSAFSPSGSDMMNRKKMLLPVGIIVLAVLLVVVFTQWRGAEAKLKQLSVQMETLQGNPQQNQEKAKEIVEKVRKLIEIPEGVEPTVAAIVDVAQLRERNAFYNKAENGDFLIVTTSRAILYDPDQNVILDVVPVQIDNAAAAASAAASAKASVRAAASAATSAR